MYSLHDYGRMIGDTGRVGPYVEALRRAIRPGAVVVDIGTGPGVWAVLACGLGAKRVYAIDQSRSIQVARELAAANGCTDRIEFIERLSTAVTLPERADVIVEDIRGVLPAHGRALEALIDARRRFLAPGGTFIPRTDTLWTAPVFSERLYQAYRSPIGPERLGLKLDRLRQATLNRWTKQRVDAGDICLAPRQWATIDYREVESPDLSGTVRWSADRVVTIHGFAIWFDSELAPGVIMSNAPDRQELIYGRGFQPLAEPVTLSKGDELCLSVRAKLMRSGYTWCWDTEVVDARSGRAGFRMRQSTFLVDPLPRQLPRSIDAAAVPDLNDEGRRLAAMLSLLGDRQSMPDDLAQTACDRFPSLFPTTEMSRACAEVVRRRYARDA
jgi:protein arginine N-methyltransferase 1